MDRPQDISINPRRHVDSRHTVAWGARRFQAVSSNSECQYMRVRRMLLFIEESIHRRLQWAVFEPQ